MTKLLVSVRSAAEARIALAAGVDLIDVKEPARGSLGAANPEVVADVLSAVAGRAPVSVALGELRDCSTGSSSLFQVTRAAENKDGREQSNPYFLAGSNASGRDGQPAHAFSALRYAKLGLAGMAAQRDWTARWSAAWCLLPDDVQRVAVVYADWRTAAAPPPDEVLAFAVACDCAAILVDTFGKQGGTLCDLWPQRQLAHFIAEVHAAERLCVLAGSLDQQAIRRVLPLQPDYIAVRGAACRGGRLGALDSGRVKRLADLVQGRTGHRVGAAAKRR